MRRMARFIGVLPSLLILSVSAELSHTEGEQQLTADPELLAASVGLPDGPVVAEVRPAVEEEASGTGSDDLPPLGDEPSGEVEADPKASCQHCPVRLVEVASKDVPEGEEGEGAGLRLNEAGLEYLAAQRSPLFLVPALGVYRGGKSLLLNRLMGIKAPYRGGFGVGHGQQTYTRGIDICAEQIPEGTVVWMDTEGLFSSEDARSSYGPKIFSLALLFSSAVLLNNLKVLNQQFFVFFEEQQQVARILREGLRSEGLQSDLLLAANLSVVWVLQQPINYTTTVEAGQQQLDSFLTIQDKARQRVREDFRHLIHEVPTATHDSRLWPKLDQVRDEELLPEYIDATQALRHLLLQELQQARPFQAASIAAHLRMYVDLVQNDHFSVSLAREAFEDSHIAQLCERFGAQAEDLAGPLPSPKMAEALDVSEEALQESRDQVVKDFHLDEAFLRRLRQCLQKKRDDLESLNAELVLDEWKTEALSIADSGNCFFLGTLARRLPQYREKYGRAFTKVAQAKAREYGSDLQRARLTGCVHLHDFLLPFAPWLAWPVVSLYLRQGLVSGILAMILHGIVLAGVYTMLQFMNQLPPYLDLHYEVLKHHPGLRNLVMRAPQTVPWSTISKVFGLVGALHSAWRLLTNLSKILRSLNQGSSVGQLTNLELKMNMLLDRSQAEMKKTITMSALEAAVYIDSSDAPAAALALVRGLMVVGEVNESDVHFAHLFEVEHRKLALEAARTFQLPDKSQRPGRCSANKEDAENIVRLAAARDWEQLIPSMVKTLDKLTGASKERDASAKSPKRAVKKSSSSSGGEETRMKLFQEPDDKAESDASEEGEEAEEPESCCRCCGRCFIMLLATIVGIWVSAWLLESCRRAGLLPVPVPVESAPAEAA